MRNIELKARLRDLGEARLVCRELGAVFQGDIHQVDTYFRVPEGRFKLRASDPGKDYLVYYRRPDTPGPKGCDYVMQDANRSLCGMLGAALGVLAVVDKVRSLYLWGNVRIHLDQVEGLGFFIEFEAVLSSPDQDGEGHKKVAQLIKRFGLPEEAFLEASYLDMALAKS